MFFFLNSRLVFHSSRSVFLGSRLVFHGSRLVFMVLGGFLWFQLGFHGFHGSSWVFLVVYGSRLVFHGSRSGSIIPHCSRSVFPGFRLVLMVTDWFLWFLLFQVGLHGLSWFQVGFHGARWVSMVFHGSRLFFHGSME